MSELKKILATSMNFEEKMRDRDERSKKVAWSVAIAAGVLLAGCIVALILMLPLRQTDVALYTVDSHTGRARFVTRVNERDLPAEEALGKAFAANYVNLRERYNYFSLQHDYDTTQLFGSEQVNADYLDWFNSSQSPEVYQDAANVVDTEVISNVVTPATAPDMLATLRLKRTIRHVADGMTRVEFWDIRLTYHYLPQKALTEAQRESDPLGFIVTSYQRDKELRNE